MNATDIDGLTFSQFILYFASDEDVKGETEISPGKLKKILKGKTTDSMTREDFLKRGEEIRERKKKEFADRRQVRIDAAKGKGKTK
jgi:hypothetical protein